MPDWVDYREVKARVTFRQVFEHYALLDGAVEDASCRFRAEKFRARFGHDGEEERPAWYQVAPEVGHTSSLPK